MRFGFAWLFTAKIDNHKRQMQYKIWSWIEHFISTFRLQQMIDLHLTSYSFCCLVESSHHYFVNTFIDLVNEPILGLLYIS